MNTNTIWCILAYALIFTGVGFACTLFVEYAISREVGKPITGFFSGLWAFSWLTITFLAWIIAAIFLGVLYLLGLSNLSRKITEIKFDKVVNVPVKTPNATQRNATPTPRLVFVLAQPTETDREALNRAITDIDDAEAERVALRLD